jgi:predicted transcriptional regulator
MDLQTLERLTVVKLREEALKIPELSGARAMSREELIRAIAGALDIDLRERRKGGAGRDAIKKLIRELKPKIAEAIQQKNRSELKALRRHVKRLKAQTRHLAKAKPPPRAAGPEAATQTTSA